MKCNKWTVALAAAGVVSLGSIAQAEEAQHQVLTALSSTTLSGYVDTSAIWKFGSDNHGESYTGIPGRSFDGSSDKLDGFNLHAVKLTLEKPLDEGQWAAGYKADLVMGPDANFYSGTTLNGGAGDNSDELAIKQAYVMLRAPVGNGIDFKVGVFDTIVGYEVFDSPNNPNFSRSYGFWLEPTQHTGVLATYNIVDWLSVSAGVANTAYGPINGKGHQYGEAESSKTFMGSVVVTMPEATGPLAGSVLYAGIIDGSAFGVSTEDATHFYVGGTFKTPLEGLSLGAAWDYRSDGPTIASDIDNRAYSLAGYASYAFTEKFKANARVDFVNADAGTFYGIAAGTPGGGTGGEEIDTFATTSGGGYHYGTAAHEKLLAATFTLDYSLWDNVLTRAELRWDHSLNGDRPYGNGNEKNAVTLAANIVYKF